MRALLSVFPFLLLWEMLEWWWRCEYEGDGKAVVSSAILI
jgi:hypothetical protein